MASNIKLVEKLFQDIMNEDFTAVKETLTTNKDLTKLSAILRHEMPIVTLMGGLLESDILLPRLVVCGVRTMSPLHYSALRGADKILSNILAYARISAQSPLSGGSTPLHFACFAGNLSTIKILIDEWSADLHVKDSYGWSPLHYASIGGQPLVVEELCSRGANAMDRDQDGTTSAYRAQIFGHENIVEYFKKITKNNPKLLTVEQGGASNNTIYGAGNTNSGKTPSGDLRDLDFIIDNAYDFPDDNMVTRIQCKYVSSAEMKDNKNATTNNSNDKTIVVSGSIYDLPDDMKTKASVSANGGSFKKEQTKKKIQSIVEDQFKDVFGENADDPYLKPIGAPSAGIYDTISSNNGLHIDIGFKTLKYLLRSEFQKYKSTLQPSPVSSSGTSQQQSFEDPIYDDIYEEIVKGSIRNKENNWIKGGQTLKKTFNQQRPPLPPRSSKINDDLFKPPTQQQLQQQQQQQQQQQHIQLQPIDSFNTEFNIASQKLNLLEESQVVKQVCFTELLNVLGAGDWQKLAQALPIRRNKALTDEKIKMIEKEFPKDPRKQAQAALQDWNQHFGKNATLDKLVEAMKKSGLVEKIKNVEMARNQEFAA